MKTRIALSITFALATCAQVAPAHRTNHISIEIPKAKPYKWAYHVPKGKLAKSQLSYPMAATIWGEARNQPIQGQRAVGHVIMNRIHARKYARFGKGLRGVVWKRKHFSCWNQGDPNREAFLRMIALPDSDPQKQQWYAIRKLAADIYAGRDKDNTGGATYYATTAITPYWRNDMTVVGIMYDHVFFRPKTAEEWRTYRRDMKANAQLERNRRIAREANAKSRTKGVKHHG